MTILNFRNSVFISGFLHFAAILGLFIYMNLYTTKPISLTSKALQGSVKVDLVGLPNILKKDIVEMNNAEKAKETNPDDMALEKKKTISKLKTIEKLKDTLKKQEYLKKLKKIKGLKENKIFSGTSFVKNPQGIGDSTSEPSTQLEYIEGLKTLIRTNWEIPEWMQNSRLNAFIFLKIKPNGEIYDLKITKSSGNASFDNHAISSINKVSVFPSPPYFLQKTLNEEGVTFSFP